MQSKVCFVAIIGLCTGIFQWLPLSAQSVLSGKIVDAHVGTGLAGVEFTGDVQGKSDPNGNFSFKVFSFPLVATASLAGYTSLEFRIASTEQEVILQLQPSTYDMQEVVLSAFHLEGKLLEQAGGITVLTDRELQRDNPSIITPALNRVPGVYMHSGTYNTNRITIRGIGARSLFSTAKLRAYLDDIPLTSGDGETTLEDIDISLLDRVEVIKGPASSMYGAGLGGSINMVSKSAPPLQTRISTEFVGGSYGLQRNVSRLQHSGSNSQIQFNFNRTHSDGYRANNTYDRSSFTTQGRVYGGSRSSISFLASWISLKAFIPSSLNEEDFRNDPQKAAFTWNKTQGFEDYDKLLAGVSWKYAWSDQWDQSISFFGGFRGNYEPRPFNILRENNQNLGVRAFLRYKSADTKWKWVVGTESFGEWYNWQTYQNIEGLGDLGGILSDNQERRRYLNLFTHAEWKPLEKTTLQLGTNFNSTQYTYTDFFAPDSTDLSGDYRFDPSFSPRLALVQQISDQQAVHLSISHGFSPPSLEETLTPDGVINPDIQPETGWNLEVGSRGKIGQRLSYDVTLYTMLIRNLLVARRSGQDAFIGVNAGRTTHTGLEAALDYRIIDQKAIQLYGFGSYTYAGYQFTEFVDGEDDYSGNALTGTPPHHLILGLDMNTKPGVYATLNLEAVDAMPMRDDNSVFSDAYQLVNTKVGWKKKLGNSWELNIYGGIQNLLNEQYASMILVNAGSFGGAPPRYYYPGLPRNFFAGIALGFDSPIR